MRLSISVRTLRKSILGSAFARRIAYGSLWSLIAALLSRGSPIVAMIGVAHVLEKTSYGKLGIIQSSVAMFSVLAAAGMGITAAKYIASSRKIDKERVSRIIALATVTSFVMGIILAVVLFISAPWLATNALAAPDLIHALRIGAVILMLSAWMDAQTGILTGFEAFPALAITNGGSGIVAIPAIIYGAYIGGISGALWGIAGCTLLAVAMNSVVIYRLMRKEGIPLSFSVTFSEWKLLWHFSVPAILAGVMIGPVIWIGATLLVKQSNGYAEMAIFSAANQWFSALLFLPGVVTNALLPIFCDYASLQDSPNIARSVKTSTRLVAFVSLPMGALAIISSPIIMSFYGASYASGWPVLFVIVLAAMAAAFLNLYGNLLAAYNRMWAHFSTNIMWAVIYLISAAVLLHFHLGALALALALLIAYSVKALVVKAIVTRHMRCL